MLLNLHPIDAVITEVKVIDVKINAISRIPLTIFFSIFLNVITFSKFTDFIGIEILVETLVYGGLGVLEVIRQSALLEQRIEVTVFLATETLIYFMQFI